ncbi:hypothetical protein X757_03275 [Mesorhizobium sp. LSHC414A00]|nr:hypothetical protein X757_03275 [Mesorhizobium sp. LSHC414A00]
MVALVVALYNPIADTVRAWLGWDGANIHGYLLNPDTINIGLDDKPPGQRVDTVTQYEKLLRVGMINKGYSIATLSSNFVCTGENQKEGDKRYVFSFDFYDAKDQIKLYPEIDAQSGTAFIGKLSGAQLYTEAEVGVAGPNKCTFAYFDKYGFHPLLLDLGVDDAEMLSSLLK